MIDNQTWIHLVIQLLERWFTFVLFCLQTMLGLSDHFWIMHVYSFSVSCLFNKYLILRVCLYPRQSSTILNWCSMFSLQTLLKALLEFMTSLIWDTTHSLWRSDAPFYVLSSTSCSISNPTATHPESSLFLPATDALLRQRTAPQPSHQATLFLGGGVDGRSVIHPM